MKKESDTIILAFRATVVVLGSIALWLGWSAQSQGILWHTGRNARIEDETSTSTLSWVVYGVLLILAGIIPRTWLSRHLKR